MSDSSYMQGDKDNAVAVPFSDDDNDTAEVKDLFAEDSPTATPEERATRKQKQSERVSRLLSEGRQSKAEAKELKERQQQLESELANLRARVMQPPPQAPPADGKDRWDRELDAVYEKQTNAYTAAQAEVAAGKWTPERQKYYEGVAREVESAKARIHTERSLEQSRQSMRAEQAQQQWVNKYPEVYRDPRAYQFAEASFRRKQALLDPGQTPTNEMVDEAMNEAIVQFRLRGKPAPSASDKAKLSGVPSSGGGGNSGPTGIQMTPELRRMAVAAYSELPEAEAIKQWVNTTGKRLRERKII